VEEFGFDGLVLGVGVLFLLCAQPGREAWRSLRFRSALNFLTRHSERSRSEGPNSEVAALLVRGFLFLRSRPQERGGPLFRVPLPRPRCKYVPQFITSRPGGPSFFRLCWNVISSNGPLECPCLGKFFRSVVQGVAGARFSQTNHPNQGLAYSALTHCFRRPLGSGLRQRRRHLFRSIFFLCECIKHGFDYALALKKPLNLAARVGDLIRIRPPVSGAKGRKIPWNTSGSSAKMPSPGECDRCGTESNANILRDEFRPLGPSRHL